MVKPAVGIDGFRGEMRCDTFYDHIATKNDIVKPHRHMSCTMPGQVDHIKKTNLHVAGFVRKVHRDGLVKGFRKTVNAEELIPRFVGEATFRQESFETATIECKPGLVVRHRLEIQFVASN